MLGTALFAAYEVIVKGRQDAATLRINEGLLNLLQGTTVLPSPPLSVTDAEREAAIDVALDFVNSF